MQGARGRTTAAAHGGALLLDPVTCFDEQRFVPACLPACLPATTRVQHARAGSRASPLPRNSQATDSPVSGNAQPHNQQANRRT